MRRTEQAQGLRLMKFEEVYARTTARLLSQAEAAEVLGDLPALARSLRGGGGVRFTHVCCSACIFDPPVSSNFNSLSCRSARNPRAEQHTV